jgi:aspartyl-tRNA(Asn)/glutamyl-tRNA(Gln) amidotransferase subunit B
MAYKPTIGLEIHAELSTRTKMFCDCDNNPMEINPNTNVCPICLGHPGTLPKMNRGAVDSVIKTGLALDCQINRFSKFDRKNYFYPDLPKAYQISQYDKPLCVGGCLVLPSTGKKIRITRIHLEEDTGRLAHSADGQHSLVDFNRAGVPLMELVTEPDIASADEAVEFSREFQLILRYLGVSDGDMEKGHMRVEVNTSVSKEGEPLGTKVEIKNLNSFKSVADSIDYEIKRQSEEIEKGEKIIQETRGWDETKQKTISQRSKEEAHDYRYFPEPDLPPMVFDDDYINAIKAQISELPQQRRERFSSEYNLSDAQAELLIRNPEMSEFFERAVSELKSIDPNGNPEMVYNYLTSDIKGIESEKGITLTQSKLEPEHLAHLVLLLTADKISSRVAKDVLLKSFETGQDPEDAIKEGDLSQISDKNELESIIRDIIDKNEKVCYDYKNGKENALQFLVGQVMAKTKGKANPEITRQLFKKLLS